MNFTHSLKRTLILLLVLLSCSVSLASAQSGAELFASYEASAERVDGQAFIEITPFTAPVYPVVTVLDPNTPLWQIGYFVKETNSVPVTIHAISFVRFDADKNVLADFLYEGDEMPMAGFSYSQLTPYEAVMGTVFQPLDSTAFYGIRLYGVDANGNDVTASILIPLAHELLPAQTPDAFHAETEGATLISLTASENPVYPQEHEFFGNGAGWFFDVTVKNVTDAPVMLEAMTLIFFNDEGNISFQYNVDSSAIADWAGVQSHVLAPGESIVLSDMCPLQSLMGFGYRFTASTEDGRTQCENLFVEMAKELKAE